MQTIRILWAALMASVVMLGVVSFVVSGQGHSPQFAMLIGLGVSAVAEAVMSFVLPANGLKTGFRTFSAETVERSAPGDESAMFGGQATTQKVFKHPGKAFKAGLIRYQTAFILSLALSEAVAINGVILAQLGFDPVEFLPFVAVGFLLMAIRYPTEERIMAVIEKGTGVRFPKRG
jgi:hypothetical protein